MNGQAVVKILIKSGARASLFGDAIDWLVSSGVVLSCEKITHGYMPPAAYRDPSSFNQYLGAMTENYVACALAANGYELMYWASKHTAEIDFVIVKEGEAIPVEVKSSVNTKSKSLNVYIASYEPSYSIRISPKNFGFENGIKSIPLYSVFCI